MSDRPILFSAPMVRALLDGRKIQTRRILKPQPGGGHAAWQDEDTGLWYTSGHGEAGDWGPLNVRFAAGDRLWVRETLFVHNGFGTPLGFSPQVREGDNARVWSYGADEIDADDKRRGVPAIHMPRAFSRLTLDVTDVRVERLQAMHHKADEFRAEGVELPPTELYPDINTADKLERQFSTLWGKINGAGAWDTNPWIVVVAFSVEKRNIDVAYKAAA